MADKNISEYSYKEMSGEMFYELFPTLSKKLVKLTNSDECHRGFEFKTGLNVDDITFNPTGQNKAGGLYFTDIDNIIKWISYFYSTMIYCRAIKILPDSRIYIEDKGKFKADKIMLGERVKIEDLSIWSDEEYCLNLLTENEDKTGDINKKDIIYNAHFLLKYIKNFTENIKLSIVKAQGFLIGKLIELNLNVSEEIQLEAVKNNGASLMHILYHKIKPSEQIQLEAVKNNPSSIQYLLGDKNKIEVSEDVKLAAVSKSWYCIKFLTEAGIEVSEEIQISAVKQNKSAIKYINNPSERVRSIESYIWNADSGMISL